MDKTVQANHWCRYETILPSPTFFLDFLFTNQKGDAKQASFKMVSPLNFIYYMNNENLLSKIQSLIKAPKGQFNSFGKYKYRSCEDIVEAIKPVINPLGFWLTLSDDIVEVAGRVYVKTTATLTNGKDSYQTTAFAREEETKKGMDGSQITGAASSYARKYALNGLFAIDDTKDSDHTNNKNITEDVPAQYNQVVDDIPDLFRDELLALLNTSTYEGTVKDKLYSKINGLCTRKEYDVAKANLLANQLGIEGASNPSQREINKHVRKIAQPV